jgi:hypothetical protein
MTDFLRRACNYRMAWAMGALTTLIAICTVWKASTDSIDAKTWAAMEIWDRVNKVYALVFLAALNNIKAYLDSSISRAREANGVASISASPIHFLIAGTLLWFLIQ